MAAEPGWADAKLREAVANLRTDPENLEAARTLSFLHTEAAAPRLVEFFSKLSGHNIGRDLRFGLFGSPYRKAILAAMESDLESPDVAISERWMGTMIDLVVATAMGPRPLQSRFEVDRYMAQFPPVVQRYYDKLAIVAESKQGQARVVTLQTLAKRPR